jgi:hypothetical protein
VRWSTLPSPVRLPANGGDILASPPEKANVAEIDGGTSATSPTRNRLNFDWWGLLHTAAPFHHHPQKKLRSRTSVVAKSESTTRENRHVVPCIVHAPPGNAIPPPADKIAIRKCDWTCLRQSNNSAEPSDLRHQKSEDPAINGVSPGPDVIGHVPSLQPTWQSGIMVSWNDCEWHC